MCIWYCCSVHVILIWCACDTHLVFVWKWKQKKVCWTSFLKEIAKYLTESIMHVIFTMFMWYSCCILVKIVAEQHYLLKMESFSMWKSNKMNILSRREGEREVTKKQGEKKESEKGDDNMWVRKRNMELKDKDSNFFPNKPQTTTRSIWFLNKWINCNLKETYSVYINCYLFHHVTLIPSVNSGQDKYLLLPRSLKYSWLYTIL